MNIADEAERVSESDADAIQRLAGLPQMEYDRIRKQEAKSLGVQIGTLDRLVKAIRKDDVETDSGLTEIEPWPDPVNPSEVLSEIAVTVRRFIVCQPETANAVALWAAMTWFIDVVLVAPLAVITAPEKRCGKSQMLFLLGRLVNRPLAASNISPSALFRAIDAWRPTLLIDEADSFMRENEELRGILNCGHTRDSAYVVRVVGENFTPTRFNVWGAKALAGIGHLADTLMDRSVVLELRRKLPHETVERLRHAEPKLFETLAAKLARFAEDYSEQVRLSRPELPESLNDRAQDSWEPLLAIADIAGDEWPLLARKAALKLSRSDDQAQSIGVELLADIQEIFETKRIERISSAELIASLCEDEEKPWASYNRGKQIAPRQVSKKLDGYGIRSKNIRFGFSVSKGFEREQFDEAFLRYLSAPYPENPLQRYKQPEATSSVRFDVAEAPLHSPLQQPFATVNGSGKVATNPLRSASENIPATLKAPSFLNCSGVADRPPIALDGNKKVRL